MRKIDLNDPQTQRDIKEEALYIIENKATVRQAAQYFTKSKTFIHNNMRERLKIIDQGLYVKVSEVLDYNKSVRHIRGGQTTQKLWQMANIGELNRHKTGEFTRKII